MATKAKAAAEDVETIETTTAKTTDKTQVMYLGPNIYRLDLITGRVYIDGVPEAWWNLQKRTIHYWRIYSCLLIVSAKQRRS